MATDASPALALPKPSIAMTERVKVSVPVMAPPLNAPENSVMELVVMVAAPVELSDASRRPVKLPAVPVSGTGDPPTERLPCAQEPVPELVFVPSVWSLPFTAPLSWSSVIWTVPATEDVPLQGKGITQGGPLGQTLPGTVPSV